MRAMYWVGVFLACAVTASASIVPNSFNYQGVLRGGSGEMLAAGTRTVEFRLYSLPTGGSALWGRGYAVILDTNGLFNVTLTDGSGSQVSDPSAAGATLPYVIAHNSSLFLGVLVTGNTEIAPRQQLLSVPFAMMAGDVKQSSGDVTVNGTLHTVNSVQSEALIQARDGLNIGSAKTGGQVMLMASSLGELQTPALIVSGNASVSGRVRDKTGYVMPVGSLLPYAGKNAPDGWLLCNGWSVPRTTYADLFTVISTTYGAGDGSTTFTLPDMQGRTAIGAGQGSQPIALANRTLGQKDGEETHILSTLEMPAHTHGYTTYGSYRRLTGVLDSTGTKNSWQDSNSSVSTVSAGGNQGHNTMPPFLVLNYIIKY